MRQFDKLIKELFDSTLEKEKVKYKVISDNSNTYSVSFKISGFTYIFSADFFEAGYLESLSSVLKGISDSGVWEISFYLDTPDKISYNVQNNINIPSKKVFGIVVDIIKRWLFEHKNVEYIYFSAKEKSRISLYNAMGKYLSTRLGFFEVPVEKKDTVGNPHEYYLFKRKS